MVTTITSSSLNHDRYFNRWHALMAGTLIVIAMVLVVGSAPARAETPSYVPDEILVGYLKQVAPSDITAFEKSHKLILLKEFTPLNVRHYRLPESLSVEMALELLKTEPIVDFVEPNLLEKALFLPSDPQFGEQWSLQNSGQIVNGIGGPPDIDIDWPEAMDIYTGTADVIVAVIDSGVAVDHPEIDPNGWVNIDESLDSIDNDANGYIDDVIGWDFFDNDLLPLDENGHGTLVASIIGGPINNGVGGAGVAPRIKLMLLRAGDDFGSVSNSATIDAAIYATSMGAKIINYSAGGTQVSSALQALIAWLDQQGVLLVAAAGNGGPDGIGDNNDTFPVYPASYAKTMYFLLQQ